MQHSIYTWKSWSGINRERWDHTRKYGGEYRRQGRPILGGSGGGSGSSFLRKFGRNRLNNNREGKQYENESTKRE